MFLVFSHLIIQFAYTTNEIEKQKFQRSNLFRLKIKMEAAKKLIVTSRSIIYIFTILRKNKKMIFY